MFEGLATLLEIQEKDREVLSLREREHGLIGGLSEKEDALERLQGELQSEKGKLKEMRVARKEQEIELDSKLEAIQKMEAQLFQLKTNEEYQALQKEIESIKRACTSVEDDILNLMEGIEESQKAVEEREGAVAGVQEEIERAKAALGEEKKAIAAEIDRLEGEKKILSSSVAPPLLERYERTIRHYRSTAIVPVIDNICQGCYTDLPRHTVEKIRLSGEPIFCQNCSRFLYLKES